MLPRMFRAFKNTILPAGPKYRKLVFGPAAGCIMQVDFRSQTRTYLGLYEFELNKYWLSAKAAECCVGALSEQMQDSEPKMAEVAHPARTPQDGA